MLITLLVPGVVFLSVCVVVGVLAFVFRSETPKAATRLDLLVGKRRKDDDPQADILRKSAFEGDKKSLMEMLTPKFMSPQKLFEQADCHIKPATLTGIGIGLTLASMTIGFFMGAPLILLPINGVFMFSLPWIWLIWKRSRRLSKFASQLPDALELVARALRAGHSLGAGMHVVAEEMPDPIAGEFGRVFEEQNLGIPIDEALKSMSD